MTPTSGHDQIVEAIQDSIRQLLALEKLVRQAGDALEGWCVTDAGIGGSTKLFQLSPVNRTFDPLGEIAAREALSPGPWHLKVEYWDKEQHEYWQAPLPGLSGWQIILHRPEPEPVEGEVRPSLVELRPDKADAEVRL
jgi:hypothetical protein